MKYHDVISEEWKAFLEDGKGPSDPSFPQRCAHKSSTARAGLWRAGPIPPPRGGGSAGVGSPQPLSTGACGDRERPRSSGDTKPARIWISRAQAQHSCSTAQAGINPESSSSREEEEAEIARAPRQRCAHRTGQGRAALSAFSSLLPNWPPAQADKSPRRSRQNLCPDTNLLKWQMTQYSGFLGFTNGWAALLSSCSLYLRKPVQLRIAQELQHAAIPVSCKV